MQLDKVALVDGWPYAHHAIVEVSHDYRNQTTSLYVESWTNDDAIVGHVIGIDLSDGMDEESAYGALDASLPEWQDPQESLDEVLGILTDEQAEQVPDAFPTWAAGTWYEVGKRVRHDGRLYRCVQAHTSQTGWEPPSVPALWVRTSDDPIPEWVQPAGAHDAYASGDKVRHVGKVWESLVDGNVWEPSDAVPTLWATVA